MQKALQLANYLGIQRIQLAGYDVYYETSDADTKNNFLMNLKICVQLASKYGVILAFETMETPFMNTVKKAMYYVEQINSPYLQIYPDLGNLYNGNEGELATYQDIACGKDHLVAAHLKDTVPGVFRDLQFGEGRVNFKQGIETFYEYGVRIFNCEIWDDKSGNYLDNLKKTLKVVGASLK